MASVWMSPAEFVSTKRTLAMTSQAVPEFKLLRYFNCLWIAS